MDLFNKFDIFNDLYLVQVAYLSIKYSPALLDDGIEIPNEIVYIICSMIQDNIAPNLFHNIYGKVSLLRRSLYNSLARYPIRCDPPAPIFMLQKVHDDRVIYNRYGYFDDHEYICFIIHRHDDDDD